MHPAPETSRIPWWLWPQVLCLDAPAVAVAWMAVLAHGHHLNLPAAFYWGLALVTWMVYLLDRTADAISGRLAQPLSARHAFCLQHAGKILWGVLPLAVITTGWIALTQLPVGLLGQGMLLSLCGTIYLASYSTRRQSSLHLVLLLLAMIIGVAMIELWRAPSLLRGMALLILLIVIISVRRQHPQQGSSKLLPKEVLASLLFALGSSAGVHFWTPTEHGLFCVETLLMWGLFAFNMLSIVRSEQITGQHCDPQSSLALNANWSRASLLLGLVLIASCAWQLIYAGNDGVRHTALLAGLSSALLISLHQAARKLPTELFHLLADAALLAPLPLLWWLA